MERTLDLTFTPEARERALSFLSSITDYPPTLCLMKAVSLDEPEGWWTYGVYAPSNIEVVEPALRERGHALLYRADGLLVAIPQYQFVPELVGKTIGLGDGRLLVLQRAPRA